MGTLYRNGIPYIGGGGGGGSEGVELTQAEYDALTQEEKLNGTIYFITDSSTSYPTASLMRYDNSESGLSATNVQDALDELNACLTWKKLVSEQITGNGSYPLLNDLNGATEVLIQLYSGNEIRQSLTVSVAQLRASLVFPDFYFAGYRLYCQMDVTSSSILISNFNAPSQLSGASLLVQYR